MSLGFDVLVLAGAGGALGGLSYYLYLAFGGFQKIPTTAQKLEKGVTEQRILFLIGRILFGIACADIVAFWLFDDFARGVISNSKMLFFSALVGFSTNSLSILSGKLGKIFDKLG